MLCARVRLLCALQVYSLLIELLLCCRADGKSKASQQLIGACPSLPCLTLLCACLTCLPLARCTIATLADCVGKRFFVRLVSLLQSQDETEREQIMVCISLLYEHVISVRTTIEHTLMHALQRYCPPCLRCTFR